MNGNICGYVLTLTILLNCFYSVENRYLPTRSQEDGLDRLRNLLKDILESDVTASVQNYQPARDKTDGMLPHNDDSAYLLAPYTSPYYKQRDRKITAFNNYKAAMPY